VGTIPFRIFSTAVRTQLKICRQASTAVKCSWDMSQLQLGSLTAVEGIKVMVGCGRAIFEV